MKTTKQVLLMLFLTLIYLSTFGQHLALTFEEAKEQGVPATMLDSIYTNAVSADTTKPAVFKTEFEMDTLYKSYANMLQAFGKFLADNNFYWNRNTRCFNRVYFNKDGRIDYFLFRFTGRTEEERPTQEKQEAFHRLLNLFVEEYQFPLKTQSKFVQCGGAVYTPKQ